MAKVGAWLIAAGFFVGGVSVALYLARQGEVRNGGVAFDASPYLLWGGIAGVAVTCGTVLLAAAHVIIALRPVEPPAPPLRSGATSRPRSHYE